MASNSKLSVDETTSKTMMMDVSVILLRTLSHCHEMT